MVMTPLSSLTYRYWPFPYVQKHLNANLYRPTYPPVGPLVSGFPINVHSNQWSPCNKHGANVQEGLQGEALLHTTRLSLKVRTTAFYRTYLQGDEKHGHGEEDHCTASKPEPKDYLIDTCIVTMDAVGGSLVFVSLCAIRGGYAAIPQFHPIGL
jgi:hypothetical protein